MNWQGLLLIFFVLAIAIPAILLWKYLNKKFPWIKKIL